MTVFARHKIAFFLALAVGLIYVSHHFFIPRFIDSEKGVYYPITRGSYYDETIFYGPRANAVYHDPPLSGDSGLYEHRRTPAVFSMLNPLIMAGLAAASGSLKAAFIVSDFIFPALIFLLLYFIALEMSSRKVPALIFSSIFVFAPKIGIYIPPVTALNFQKLAESLLPFWNPSETLYFSQFDEPKITFVFFLAAFYFGLRALRRKENWSLVVSGLGFGLMFYTYLFDWAFFAVSLALAAVVFLLFRRFAEFKIILLILVIGFLLSFEYWINLADIYQLPQAGELLSRTGNEMSHTLRLASVWKSYLRNLVLIFLLAGLWIRRDKIALTYLASFLLAYFITVNVQVVTGFNLQPDHWYRTQFLPVALVVFMIALWFWERYRGGTPVIWRRAPLEVRRQRRLPFRFWRNGLLTGRAAGPIFILYFFAANLGGQYLYSRANASSYVVPLEKIESYEWLNKNTPKYSVVGAFDFSVTNDIQLHTHNKTFLPFMSTAAPDQEIWERAMYLARVFGVSAEDFEKFLRESGAVYFLFMEQYGDHSFDAAFKGYDRKFPEELVREKTAEYAAYSALKAPYRLDYLYLDKRTAFKDPSELTSGLEKAYDKDQIIIYKINESY